MFFLLLFAAVVRLRLRCFKEILTGFQNAIEAAVEAFDNFAARTLGERVLIPISVVFHGFCLYSLQQLVQHCRTESSDSRLDDHSCPCFATFGLHVFPGHQVQKRFIP